MLKVIFLIILKILFIDCDEEYVFIDHDGFDFLNNSVKEATKNELLEAEQHELVKFFGANPETSDVFLNYQNISKTIEKYEDVNQSSFRFHDNQQMKTFIKEIKERCPNITHSYSIGKSIEENELLVLVISKDPSKHTLLKPEISFVANIDGREHEGRENLFLLAEFLCKNYGKNIYLTKLVDEVRTHMLFSLNPDGYEYSLVETYEYREGKYNAYQCELYRNFPFRFEGEDRQSCYDEPEEETKSFIKWIKNIPFTLSAILRNDQLIAIYPVETDKNMGQEVVLDRKLFLQMSYQYARAHSTMWKTGKRCPYGPFHPPAHYHGIIRGELLYFTDGSMLDWIYNHTNTFAITIEMSCKGRLEESMLAVIWNQSKFSLISYMDLARYGIKGIVKSSNGEPLKDAKVEIIEGEEGKTIVTTSKGEYWRLLAPGNYSIKFSHPTHAPEIFNFSIEARQMMIKNITLTYIGELREMVYQLLFITHH